MISTLFSSSILLSSKRWLFFPKFSLPIALHLEKLKHVNSNIKLFDDHMDLSRITLQKAPLTVSTVG